MASCEKEKSFVARCIATSSLPLLPFNKQLCVHCACLNFLSLFRSLFLALYYFAVAVIVVFGLLCARQHKYTTQHNWCSYPTRHMFPQDSYLSSVFELWHNSWCNRSPTKRVLDHSFIIFNVFDIVCICYVIFYMKHRPSCFFFFLSIHLMLTLQLPTTQNTIMFNVFFFYFVSICSAG